MDGANGSNYYYCTNLQNKNSQLLIISIFYIKII
jgi:hypothetical protein